ncbi:MAG: hypothetical protein AB8I08_00170 [Sandaracinaceae bacterium]
MTTRRTFLGGALLGGAALVGGGSVAVAQSDEVPSSEGSSDETAPAPSSREGDPAGPVAVLRAAVETGRRLRRGEITQLGWQEEVERLLSACAPDHLARAVDLSRLRRRARPVARGASILRVPLFDSLNGDVGADMKVFFLRAGHSDPPHCHFNLVAAHVVLVGSFRVRHYARLTEDAASVALRPTHDRTIGPGQVTSISDHRDNAHWHLAQTDGVLLDVQQGRIDPSLPIRRRQMLDVDRGTSGPDGSLRAPKLSRGSALRRYG